MKEQMLVFRVPNARSASLAVRELDPIDQNILIGLGIIARGYKEDREEFYVFATLERHSKQDARAVADILGSHGQKTDFTVEKLFRGEPRPHFIAAGLGEQILSAVRAAYPEADPGPPSVN